MNRRSFLHTVAGSTALAAAARTLSPTVARAATDPVLAAAIAVLPQTYLTPQGEFYNVERGKPLPYKLPPEKRLEVGLERETWQLEILADPDGPEGKRAKLDRPRSKEAGNAFNFADLMKLAETKAVRFLKVVSCNNIFAPLGLGVWEGVPLRDVLWPAGPVENVRHIFYDGYHNDDPAQLFQCWLPANRVFEDPPGMLPVIVCYKINGEWLTGERGGPVRMVVPEAYGFKSVKWLQRVVLTNKHQSDDTYANGNNDTNDSWLKTWARFEQVPGTVQAGAAFAITGQAQVGVSGLAKVQYWLHPQGVPWPADDPTFTRAPWQDAEVLPLPERWHGGAEIGALHPAQFDAATGRPREWPMRYAWCHWAALLREEKPGKYDVRCRTVDVAGFAQPLPRPFKKSGRNAIVSQPLEVLA